MTDNDPFSEVKEATAPAPAGKIALAGLVVLVLIGAAVVWVWRKNR